VAFGAALDNHPQPARSVRIVSDRKLIATTPASYAGTVNVGVSNSCGASRPTLANRFDYRYPHARQCITGTCGVAVERTRLGHFRHVAAGFNNGESQGADRAVSRRIYALRPRSWRIGGPQPAEIRLAQRSGAATIQLLEGDWLACHTCADLKSPWRNLKGFAPFVRRDVRSRIADGTAPAYWDVWNEPGTEASPHQWFEVFNTAYHAIKNADPHAKVIAPSLGAFAVRTSTDGPSLGPFIKYAATHHDRFAAIAYHDEANAGGAPIYSPSGLRAHAARLRRMLDRYRPLRHAKIFITEYGPIPAMREPGWIVGDAGALNHSTVSQADYTCATIAACQSTFDDLFTSTSQPRMPYWVFRAYAAMHGADLRTHSAGTNITVMGARGSGSAVQVLVGRHDDCGPPPKAYVDGPAAPLTCAAYVPHLAPAVLVPLTVAVPASAHWATVIVRFYSVRSSRIGSKVRAEPEPAGHRRRVRVQHGHVHIRSLRLHDGDAYKVVVRT
jgi:hypothetical protein